METSDSDCFESADEEFYSDDEGTETIKEKSTSETREKFKHLDISEGENVKSDVTNKSVNTISDEKLGNTVTTVHNSRSTLKFEENSESVSNDIHNTIDVGGKDDNLLIISDLTDVCSTTRSENIIKSDECKIVKPSQENERNKNIVEKKLDNLDNTARVGSVTEINDNLWEGDGWEIDDDDDGDESLWRKDEVEWPDFKSSDIKEAKEALPSSKKNQNEAKEEMQDFNEDNANKAWGGWGNWGVSSILTTATQSVSTLTNQVSQGLTSVLETGIGIPGAEDLAKMHLAEERNLISDVTKQETSNLTCDKQLIESSPGFVFGNLVTGVTNITKFVESTGTKVISGGLDTLETIGKKTMEVLQEGDPGLKKKRAFLKLEQEKPVLSQVLREAKEKAENESRAGANQQKQVIKKMNYESLFDDHHGLVHLEALEMLSRQCEIKLKTLFDSGVDNALEMQETMDQVKELCELPDEDEEEQLSLEQISEKLKSAVQEINVNITYDRLISTWEETDHWLNSIKLNICDEHELHQQAIETLAQLTAIAVEQYHKTGELLLIKEHRSTVDEADSLVQLTTVLTSLIGIVAAKFSDKLNAKLSQGGSNRDTINGLITNVFFEAANSSSYIQDAFQLLVPVLQVGAV